MLQSLKIRNIALIDDITIELQNNLNILTGETGAGKSIIIDSLNFLLGARADKTLIRSGKDEARVTGVFLTPKNNAYIQAFFEKVGLLWEDTLIITRQMNLNGKSLTQVNGEFVTATMLRELTAHLIDIYGQNEHQFLLDNQNQLALLDNFGGQAVLALKQSYVLCYQQLKDINAQIKALGGSDTERLREIDLLEYQVDEIEKAQLEEGEEEVLQAVLKKLQNAEKIASAMGVASGQLFEGTGAGVLSQISQAIYALSGVSHYDEKIEALQERLSSAKIELEDIVSTLEELGSELEFDSEEFERVDHRLDQIKTLKRKYGGTTALVLEHLEKSSKRLYDLKHSHEQLQKLNSQKNNALKHLLESAKQLSSERRGLAQQLSKLIILHLADLGMQNAKLEVHFLNELNIDTIEAFARQNGADEVEFLFSANLGEPTKPLSKIISGGEMSRFMLAIKAIVAHSDNIPTMVFDEIDTGVSGKMAQAVSQKLATISRHHQVLVVSHLPQIAAMADHHFYIEKQTIDGKTQTFISQISEEKQIKELARMLSGNALTSASLENAKALKKEGDEVKQSL